jgi:hypothetical protein
MLSSPKLDLSCSICQTPIRLFAPDTCVDEKDNTVHIECYRKRLAEVLIPSKPSE